MMSSRRKQKEYFNNLKIMNEEELEESETTGAEDDDEMKAVDDMIIKASRELEQVVEENQQLLEILDKPRVHSEEQNLIFSGGGEQNLNVVEIGVIKQLEEAEDQAKATANIIYKLKTRVGELLKKEELTDEETKELDFKNIQLKESMRLLEENTRKIQNLIEKTNIVDSKVLKKNSCSISSPKTTINNTDEKNVYKMSGYNTNKKCDNIISGICSCCSENVRHIAPNVPNFAKKLCQSYSMQEKLATENASLESIRFKLQEELLNKDQSLECLERELGNLQTEMKLISKENTILNEKLKKLQDKEYIFSQNRQKPPPCGIIVKEYSDNIYQLEKQLRDMESDVKCLQEEICAVQLEREHLEKHRKMMCKSRPCVTQYLRYPFKPIGTLSISKGSTFQAGESVEQFSEQYNILDNNVKTKLSEIIGLKADYERLRNLTTEAEEFKKITENNTKECEKLMKELKAENKITSEQEHQVTVAKQRLKRAQESLKEHKILITDQKKQLEAVGNKCLEVQQKLEEQKIQMSSKIETCDGDGFNTGAQIISNLQDKLGEITL